MAQYDGSVRIITLIESKNAEKELKRLESSIEKTADKIASLRSKMDALRDVKIPTQVYKDLEKELSSAENTLDGFYKKLTEIEKSKGFTSTSTIKKERAELKEMESDLSRLISVRNQMKATDPGFGSASRSVTDYENKIDSLREKLENQIALNEKIKNSVPYKKANADIDIYKQKVNDLNVKLEDLEKSGKAFTLGQDTEEYSRMSAQVQQLTQQMRSDTERQTKLQTHLAEREEYLAKLRENAVVGNQKIIQTVERIKQLEQEIADLKSVGKTEGYVDYDSRIQELSKLKQEVKDYNDSIDQVKEKYKKLADTAKNALKSVGDVLKKANAAINSFGKRIKETFSKFTKSASDATKSANKFSLSLKNILKYGFGIRSLYVLINKIRSAIKEGFTNLYNDRDMISFKNSIDSLRASALTLKNAFAAAFSPFVEIALPYVQKLLDYMTQLLNIAGQFFAAITGRKTHIKAIKQTTDALKEETKEMNKQLSPLDKLNNLSSQKDKGKDDSTSGTMFEEVPISKSILDMAEKVKDILSKLFAPLKEAWEREGKFVMDSWKYALDKVWKLIKDIGRDFLTVWQQEKTVKIFEDLLHIIGDIGLIVGHLARNFRDAWNENKTGLHILENIRDIIGVIVHNIRLAADKTVEWADKLNFSPLLEAFERFTKSLIPLADALSGILADFYTKVLLPLATWTIEKGLPELLDVFTAFNEKVDWQALRNNLAEFWEHLEPFAETVGEGLIIFIQRVSDALADFLNSQEFKDFLVTIENWMDSVSPEDVADALEMIAKGLIALKLAVLGFGAIGALDNTFKTIKKLLHPIITLGGMVINGAKLIISGIGSILSAIGSIPAILAMVAAAVAGWKIGEWINENLLGVDTPSFHEIMDGIKSSFTDGSWKDALRLWGEDIKSTWKDIWEWVKEDFNNSILGTILGSFTDGTWRDALKLWGNDIYSAFVTLGERQSEWLSSLKNKWLQTWNNIKSGIFGVVNSIKSTVGSVLDWIGSKLKSLQSAFSSIGRGFSGGGGLFGKSRSATTPYSMPSASHYAANPAFAALSTAEIPAIATGQAIPTSMKQHFAVSESNSRESGIASLASAIEEASVNAMAKMNASNNNNSGGTVKIEIPVILNGNEIGRAMQKFSSEFFKQNGKPAFG